MSPTAVRRASCKKFFLIARAILRQQTRALMLPCRRYSISAGKTTAERLAQVRQVRDMRSRSMSIIAEERLSESPYVETITHGRTASDGSSLRPAEIHWHMVLVRQHGNIQLLVVGPWTSAGVISYTEGAEILWIKLKLGTFMPHLPTREFLDAETILPTAASQSFWLNGSAWQFPDYENADTFVERLVRDGLLIRESIVDAALQGHLKGLSRRSGQRRFLRATGLTLSYVRQIERAREAEALLEQGVSILDTVDQTGYA